MTRTTYEKILYYVAGVCVSTCLGCASFTAIQRQTPAQSPAPVETPAQTPSDLVYLLQKKQSGEPLSAEEQEFLRQRIQRLYNRAQAGLENARQHLALEDELRKKK